MVSLLQLKILACIRSLGEDAYGQRMHRELAASGKAPDKKSSIYGTLRDLTRKGLVVGRMVHRPGKKGHPRIVYSLTRAGATALAENSRAIAKAGCRGKE